MSLNGLYALSCIKKETPLCECTFDRKKLFDEAFPYIFSDNEITGYHFTRLILTNNDKEDFLFGLYMHSKTSNEINILNTKLDELEIYSKDAIKILEYRDKLEGLIRGITINMEHRFKVNHDPRITCL